MAAVVVSGQIECVSDAGRLWRAVADTDRLNRVTGAHALDAKLADPWFNLAVLHVDGGKSTEAIAAYAEYVKRDAGSGWAKLARARKGELEKKVTPAKPSKADKPVKKPNE